MGKSLHCGRIIINNEIVLLCNENNNMASYNSILRKNKF